MSKLCPFCGCNPMEEPYAMEATHCPQCGYIFEVSQKEVGELHNNMYAERRKEK